MHRLRTREAFHAAGPGSGREAVDAVKSDIGVERLAKLNDFVTCYNPKNRHERKESERFKGFSYEELLKRDKLNLDIFWLKDESLEDSAKLPEPDVIAVEIVEDLQARPCPIRRNR